MWLLGGKADCKDCGAFAFEFNKKKAKHEGGDPR